MAAAGSTSSSSPPRRGRGGQPSLNTIVEEEPREFGSLDDSLTTTDKRINRNNLNSPNRIGVVGRFDAVDNKLNWQLGRQHQPGGSLFESSTSSVSDRAAHDSKSCRPLPPTFDDLYDASEESDGDGGNELAPSADCSDDERDETHDQQRSTTKRNKYPVLFIPSPSPTSEMDAMLKNKNSPVPPTPPAKIPLSPAALSRLPGTVPPVNDAPSLAGSHSAPSSAHPSSTSAPPTPDLAPVTNPDWREQQLQVYSENEASKGSTPSSASPSPQPDIQLETPEDWSLVLDSFPRHQPGERHPEQASSDAAGSDAESQSSVSVSSSLRGVRLPRAALATLQGFDADDQSSQNSASDVDELGQMRENPTTRPLPRRRSTGGRISSVDAAVAASPYTPLSVPSPGGFFASLNGDTRRTWCLNSLDAPCSAVAEKFYTRPWEPASETVVEHVVRVNQENQDDDDDDDDGTEGPPTAKAIVPSGPPTARRIPEETATTTGNQTQSTTDNLSQDVNEFVEYDELYEDELKIQASANLDRTSHWLAAQSSYLSALGETNPLNKVDGTRPPLDRPGGQHAISVIEAKNGDRSLGTVFETPEAASSSPATPKNSLFYRGFQHVRKRSADRDAFHHSHFRFEAIQAARVSLMEKYLDHLTGRYEPNDPIRPPYRGPFAMAPRNSKQPQVLAEQVMFSKVEKEQDVLNQLHQSMWAIDALKFLNRGRLIPSPAADRLAKAGSPLGTPENAGKSRRRVLDLGGHSSCSWGWYVANEYPNVKVYTVIPKQQPVNPEIKGPANHRHVSVPQLWNLPFANNQFDLISARHLHMLLKFHRAVDGIPEPDLCLQECLRCLKPGGYIEFFTMDAELTRAGPYGSATSVEFGFNLKTRGYDPCPTRMILSRLKKAGFVKLKRAWTFLPMGTAPVGGGEEAPTHSPDVSRGLDSGEGAWGTTGSTSVVSSTTGLFGGWMWEQWMLKLQMEMERDGDAFLEEMATIFEEGRKTGAGWRCLSGWAMKPRTGRVSARSFPPPPVPPFRPSYRPS